MTTSRVPLAQHFEYLARTLATLEAICEAHSAGAEELTVGEMRACFNTFAGALEVARWYLENMMEAYKDHG
jgi:hypothetical protein